MIIYKVGRDYDRYWTCYLDLVASSEGRLLQQWDIMINLDGSRQEDKWWPRTMRIEKKTRKKLGNVVANHNSGYIIMDYASTDLLMPVMGEVELLPLICDFGDYWCLNVLTVLDCVDYEKAEYVALGENEWPPRILRFEKPAFLSSAIAGHHLFKLVNERTAPIYADDIFVKEVNKYGITGFEFIPIWEG